MHWVNSRYKLDYAWPRRGGTAAPPRFLALLQRRAGPGPGSYALQWWNSRGGHRYSCLLGLLASGSYPYLPGCGGVLFVPLGGDREVYVARRTRQ